MTAIETKNKEEKVDFHRENAGHLFIYMRKKNEAKPYQYIRFKPSAVQGLFKTSTNYMKKILHSIKEAINERGKNHHA